MNYYGWGMHTPILGFAWILGIIFWIFFAILIAKIVVYLFSNKNRSNNDSDEVEENEETALDILRKRYAKGEIDAKQFEKMKKDIK